MAAPNSNYGAPNHATSNSSAPAPVGRLIDVRLRHDEHHLFVCWVIVTRARSNNPALCHGIIGEPYLNPYERSLYGTVTPEQHERFARVATGLENLAALNYLTNWKRELEEIRSVLETAREDVMGA